MNDSNRLTAAFLIATATCFVAACTSKDGGGGDDDSMSVMSGSGGGAAPMAANTGSGGAGASSGAGGTKPSGSTIGTGGMGGAGGQAAGGSGGVVAADGGANLPAGDGGMPLDGGAGDGAVAMEMCDQIPPSSEDCAQPLAPGDARKCSITVGSTQRSYYLYAPPTYNPCKPTALIIDCHGAAETAEAQAGIVTLHTADTLSGPLDYPGIGSGWRLEADTAGGGFIVVTPQGIDNVWTTSNNDPQFFLDIVTATKKIGNIASDKVYMSGISNGSIISYTTACQHTDVFSGIAAHSAGQNCSSLGKPIPVISFDAEPDFAYSTTVDASDTMVSLDQCKGSVNPTWLTIDSKTTDAVCRNDPFDTHPKLVPCNTIAKTSITTSGIEPTVCKRWDNCSGGVAVAFCDVAPSTLHGADNAAVDAHILYGNATSLNTPSVAWRFFKSFWK
jgi:poly(3-hydroxybutyrate) depolymerase